MLETIDRTLLTRRDMLEILRKPPENIRRLFSRGNAKLGPDILTFSIPPVSTCPGRTSLCEKLCYARRGHFAWPSTRRAHAYNLVVTQRDDFAGIAVAQLGKVKERVVRLHAAGDIYNATYAEKLLQIMVDVPDKLFYLYTRSHRISAIRPILNRMGQRENVRMWFSTDAETGRPGTLSPRIRVAYMQTAPVDKPNHRVDLFFRDYSLREQAEKYAATGNLVCPAENGVSHITCQSCKLCWGTLEGPNDPRNHMAKRRTPLPIAHFPGGNQ